MAVLAAPALAQQSPAFPRNATFVIHLTGPQVASGYGEYLVPPLIDAFLDTGMTYDAGADTRFAATVQTEADVGKWYDATSGPVWLYQRSVTVGLTPADVDVEPRGRLDPSFSVTVRLLTPDQDRVDELNCLITLATRELAARYQLRGRVLVDGTRCARK